ncbi:neuraminidase-like domain-containing protein [Pseudomonas sp. NPDC089752]|uniref:Tc toxin subunit A-related protein n=1 Tax=Pseudomonas sp. NPDC089752 TaxID=3364472 RepID=UPI00382519E4
MAEQYSEQLDSLLAGKGEEYLLQIGELSIDELHEQLDSELDAHVVEQLHEEIGGACNKQLIAKKDAIIQASPLLPAALRPVAEAPAEMGTFASPAHWHRKDDQRFSAPGQVSSMFSPAAYVVELYRQAKTLYPENSQWHIDQRRPDLKRLLLSQENLDTPLSALSLSNEITLNSVRATLNASNGTKLNNDGVRDTLSTDVGTGGTPYHFHHNRLCLAFARNDPDFSHLLAATQFAYHMEDAALACFHYDIPPALRALLTDEINETNEEDKFAQYFPGVTPESMLQPSNLRSWFNVSDAELQVFMGTLDTAEYQQSRLTTRVDEKVVQVTVGGPTQYINYVRLYPLAGNRWQLAFNLKVWNVDYFRVRLPQTVVIRPSAFGLSEFVPNTEYRHTFEWENVPATHEYEVYWQKARNVGGGGLTQKFTMTYAHASLSGYLLKLNKIIRLHKVTGLSNQALQHLIQSVDPSRITDETLAIIFMAAQCVRRYGMDHQEAVVMVKGQISQAVFGAEKSQFERLFNDPPLLSGGLKLTDVRILLHPDHAKQHEQIKVSLKRAYRTDDEGLYELGRIFSLATSDDPEKSLKSVGIKLNLSDLSALYTLSLWARYHGLAPGELRMLMQIMGERRAMQGEEASKWRQWLKRLRSTSDWMKARDWSVHELLLMTRDHHGIPASTEIDNLLDEIRVTLSGAQPSEQSTEQNWVSLLSPLIASTFNLGSDTLAQALLNWADLAQPGGLTLLQACDDVRATDRSAAYGDGVVAFAYGLAQMALIAHASGVTGDALQLFVKQPKLLSTSADENASPVLPRDICTVIHLCDFTTWLSTVPDPAGTGGALIGTLGEGLSFAQLAMTSGFTEEALRQAAKHAYVKGHLLKEDKVGSWQEIQVLLQWATLANVYNVTPNTLAELLAPAADWDSWRRLADAFNAGLAPSDVRQVHAATERPLSLALTGMMGKLLNHTVQSLNERLLIDVLNSEHVTTSRIAEATVALQQFIHRNLADPEDSGAMRYAVLSRPFFRDWARWNTTYATWAAGRMLMYYPENYIDPTIRLGQTQAMDNMLQALGQAQINEDTVGDAFHGYLSAFEEVANLEILSAYHDSRDANLGKCWFVGRSRGEPHYYWWRTVDETKRAANGVLPANAWTAWTKIELAPNVHGRLIRPVVFRSRLHLGWVEYEEQVISRNSEGTPSRTEKRLSFKLAWRRFDGNWSVPISYPLAVDLSPDRTVDDLSLFFCARAGRNGLLVGMYRRSDAVAQEIIPSSGLHIREDLSSEPLKIFNPLLRHVRHWLDTPHHTGVCAIFEAPGVPHTEHHLEMVADQPIPNGFNTFDGRLMFATAREHEENGDTTYRLQLRTELSVSAKRPAIENKWAAILIRDYPTLRLQTQSVPALLRTEHGAFIVCKEGSDYWAYLCITSSRMKNYFKNANDHSLVWDGAPGASSSAWGKASGGIDAYVGRYKITNGDASPVLYNVNFGRQRETLDTSSLVSLLDYEKGRPEDSISISDYQNVVADSVPYTAINCRIYRANNSRPISLRPTTTDPLDRGVGTVQFIGNVAVGDTSEWIRGKNYALHRVEFDVAGATRTYTLKVYKDVDTLKTAIIGTSGEDAQYMAHRGQVTRLNTLFARELTEKAARGIGAILTYDTQRLAEPEIGVQVRLTLPVYDKHRHGDGRWAKVWLRLGANKLLLWQDQLSNTAHVQANVVFDRTQGYRGTHNFHLETQYSKIHNTLENNGSIIFTSKDSETLSILRDSDVHTDGVKLSKHNVHKVEIVSSSTSEVMDFTGANALYFWELFYFSPMMVMQRFMQEERFDVAEHWLKYIHNPVGYVQSVSAAPGVWNVRPLEESSSWNTEPLQSLDPDAVAQNNPFHYKMNVLMRLLDIYIGRGDAAYRKLQRDTLSEAKVWYQSALKLLGAAPWTPSASNEVEPFLGQAEASGGSHFLPEVNRTMLGYWEGLGIRQFNLRHNLTIDGQPLSLALYSTPADPKALLAAAVAAEAGSERELPVISDVPALRFNVLLDGARNMAAHLIQFGNTMQGILERQDAEALAGLLVSQGAELADNNVLLLRQTLSELAAERRTLECSLAAATASHDHYLKLYEDNVSARETKALNLRTASEIAAAAEPFFMGASAVVAAFPKVFGTSNGGANPEEALKAVAYGFATTSKGLGIAASRISQEEAYARRRADWKFHYESAHRQMETVRAQLDALTVRETSAQMHVAHLQTQAAHAQAQLALYQGKFTGKAMYSWVRARLASIFYTYYDLTVSRCLMAQKALQWEKGDSTTYLRTGTWNSAWAGLLCGEGLMLALGQMETAWVKWQKRELEVTRTVSMAKLFEGKLFELKLAKDEHIKDKLIEQRNNVKFSDAIKVTLKAGTVEVDETLPSAKLALAASGTLSIDFSLKSLNLAAGFETADSRRIRSIAVTMPALLGPYQDVHARLRTNARGLPAGCEQSDISHAVHDNGLFSQLNGYPLARQGAQLLPFEGLHIAKANDDDDQTLMTLTFINANGEQRALLERLSDIILHVQFTVR